jgi:hypothetical protein
MKPIWHAAALVAVALVVAMRAGAATLEPPDGYTQLERGACAFQVPTSRDGIADRLTPTCETSIVRIERELGADPDSSTEVIVVRVATDAEQLRAILPRGARAPAWADALAFPKERLVLLSLVDSSGVPIKDLRVVLEHELSHLVLRDILDGARVPRWFSEEIGRASCRERV